MADDAVPIPVPNLQPAPSLEDEEKIKLIKQHLALLLHAKSCYVENCHVPHCAAFKEVIRHRHTCVEGKHCTYSHCISSGDILAHWQSCPKATCRVCKPFKTILTANLETHGRNAKMIEQIDDEAFRNNLRARFTCEICLEGLKQLSCPKCWNAICKECHERIQRSDQRGFCPHCRNENTAFQVVLLPRM